MPNKRASNTLDAEGWCDQCAQQHVPTGQIGGPPCWGHTRGGAPCRNLAMHGQTKCGSHGGRTPAAIAKAAREVAEQKALVALTKLIPDNPAPIVDPIATLASLGGEVNALRAAAVTALNKAFKDNDAALGDFAMLAVYERTVDRLVRICESLVRSNYLERRAAVEEADAVRLLSAVQGGLRLIDDTDLRARVVTAIADNVRALSA